MKQRHLLGAVCACLFVLGPSNPAHATTIGARAAGGLWSSYSDGGIGSNYAYVVGDESDGDLPDYQYSYQAEASFNIGALTPVLRAEAYADDLTPMSDPYISGDAWAFQTYQNTSAFVETFVLNLNLDGSILKAPGSSYIDAEVSIFSGIDIVASSASCGGAASYLAGFGAWHCGGLIDTGFTPYIELATDGPHALADSVAFSIDPGATFSIYAELRALTFGGYADAFSTLGMTFEDTTHIEALGLASTVPVPAAAWLFGSGLLGLIGISRRKNA